MQSLKMMIICAGDTYIRNFTCKRDSYYRSVSYDKKNRKTLLRNTTKNKCDFRLYKFHFKVYILIKSLNHEFS